MGGDNLGQYAGTIISAYGQYKAAKGQQEADRVSAEMLRIQARQTIVRGREEASRSTASFLAALDQYQTNSAASNVDANTGVSKVVQEQYLEVASLESTQIKKNAQMEADNIMSNAGNRQDSAEATYHSSLLGITGGTISSLATTTKG